MKLRTYKVLDRVGFDHWLKNQIVAKKMQREYVTMKTEQVHTLKV